MAGQFFEIVLYADHFQFYLQDDDVDKGDLSEAWTKEAVEMKLAVAPFVISVGTARFADVLVKIHILPNKSEIDFTKYDLVNRCSLAIETGKIVVGTCEGYFFDEMRIEVKKGLYEVVIGYGNIDSVTDKYLEHDDFYELFLCPTTEIITPQTLKL